MYLLTRADLGFQDSVDVVYAESPSNFYVRFRRHRDKLYFIYYTVHVR